MAPKTDIQTYMVLPLIATTCLLATGYRFNRFKTASYTCNKIQKCISHFMVFIDFMPFIIFMPFIFFMDFMISCPSGTSCSSLPSAFPCLCGLDGLLLLGSCTGSSAGCRHTKGPHFVENSQEKVCSAMEVFKP